MSTGDAAGSRLASEINVTPMIDGLLVLLIIFMAIVPATSSGDKVLVPGPARRGQPSQPGAVVLKGAGDEATFKINQQAISRAELPARLGVIYANRAQYLLFVKGDDRLSFKQIAEVIDVSHSSRGRSCWSRDSEDDGGLVA